MIARSSKAAGILFTALFIGITAVSPAFAHNLNITDYDTTVSGAKLTRLDLDYSKNTSLDFDKTAETDYISGGYSLSHFKFYDSLEKSWGLNLDANYSDDTSRSGTGYSRDVSHDYTAAFDYDIYFLPRNNIYNGFGAEYMIADYADENGRTTEHADLTLDYHVGIGHVMDITPLAEAGVLEDRLMDAGALKERFSKEEMLKMAGIINKYRMEEYDCKYPDTAKGMFLNDLIEVIQGSGKLTRKLDGFSFWRISENRFVNYLRTKGWRVEVGVNRQSAIDIDYTPATGPEMANTPLEYTSLAFRGYLPLDWRSQVNLVTEYDLVTNRPDSELKDFSSATLSYTYDLTNYMWLSLSGSMTRENYSSLSLSDSSSNKMLTAGLNFKAEDNWLFSVVFSRYTSDTGSGVNYVTATGTYYFWN